MILKLNQTSAEQLAQSKPAAITAVSIEQTLEEAKLGTLQDILKQNDAIKVTLVLDPGAARKIGHLVNLEIIAKLTGVKHLVLLCFASEALDNLDELAGIDTLESFRLGGTYNKKIDLAPIQDSKGLKDFELEYGLADKKQIAFVNGLKHLQRLKVSTLDAKSMTGNTGLKTLEITNTLKNPDLLSSVYPNLDKFSISYAKGIDSFDFLSPLESLETLSIGYTNKLQTLPKLAHPQQLKSLTLINTASFDDLEGILRHKNLESLAITEYALIPFEEVGKVESLKKLKRVYLNFETEKEDQQFETLAAKNGWVTDML